MANLPFATIDSDRELLGSPNESARPRVGIRRDLAGSGMTAFEMKTVESCSSLAWIQRVVFSVPSRSIQIRPECATTGPAPYPAFTLVDQRGRRVAQL